MRFLHVTACALLLLGGCSSTTPRETEPASSATAPAAALKSAAESAPEPAIEIPERPFPDDSLYPLLVAEFALRRRQYDVALDNYMAQSEKLRDGGVSAHTTRLAQFMRRDLEALKSSQLWVKLEPDNMEARLTLANLLARNGMALQALPHMTVIARAGGVANFTSLARGFEQLNPAEQAELLGKVDSLLQELPDDTQLRLCKVLMLEGSGEPKAALQALQPIFEREPEQVQAIILDAKLRQDMGQTSKLYTRVVAALAREPDNNRLRLQYARLLTRTDMAEAERQFEILLDTSPEDPDLLFSMALIQREMDDLEAARESLEKLLELNVRNDEAHYYLGKTAEDQKRWEDALVHYMQVQPGRDFGASIDRLSRLMLAAGQSAELGTYFDHLRQQYPQLEQQLYSVQADKLMVSGHLTEAQALLDRGLSSFPENTALLYTRSIVTERLGNYPQAEVDLRSILSREPDNSTALNALGYMLSNRTDRYQEAETLIARALALSPDEAAILDSMGWVKYRLGDYEAALPYLEQAFRAFPDPEVAAHLGEVLWALGREGDAIDIWNQALQTNPQHEILLETVQRLGGNLAVQ